MSEVNFKWLRDRAEDLNETFPGKGKWIGLNPKKDFFTPIDAVPFAGGASKLNNARKLLWNSKAGKWLASGAWQTAQDILLYGGLGWAAYQRFKGSGAPSETSQLAPKRPARPKSARKSRCPPGHKWDSKKRRCVRIGRR